MRCGGDSDVAIRLQRFNKPINQSRIDQRLVALYVDNDRKFLRAFCYLGNAIRSTLMFGRSEGDLRAPGESRFGDAHVVSGYDRSVDFSRATAAFPDMSKQWFARDFVKWFPGKS
jgi:hypothetical protein